MWDGMWVLFLGVGQRIVNFSSKERTRFCPIRLLCSYCTPSVMPASLFAS
jgi:hypothetical protein